MLPKSSSTRGRGGRVKGIERGAFDTNPDPEEMSDQPESHHIAGLSR